MVGLSRKTLDGSGSPTVLWIPSQIYGVVDISASGKRFKYLSRFCSPSYCIVMGYTYWIMTWRGVPMSLVRNTGSWGIVEMTLTNQRLLNETDSMPVTSLAREWRNSDYMNTWHSSRKQNPLIVRDNTERRRAKGCPRKLWMGQFYGICQKGLEMNKVVA